MDKKILNKKVRTLKRKKYNLKKKKNPVSYNTFQI